MTTWQEPSRGRRPQRARFGNGDHRLADGQLPARHRPPSNADAIEAHPDVTAIYAHNDEMAISAIAAVREAGRKPGEDITVVSIDGENAALDAILDGTRGATVESSPFFGPIAFDTMDKYIAGEDLPDWIKVEMRFFDKSNAAEFEGKQF